MRENGFTWTLFELASRYTRQPSAFISHSREDEERIDDSRRAARNDIFISHSHNDQELVDEFVEQLRRVVNYFAWPVHIRMTNDKLDSLAQEVDDVADLMFLDMEGSPITMERRRDDTERASRMTQVWADGSYRDEAGLCRGDINARILLGGQVENYKGRMPGDRRRSAAVIAIRVSQCSCWAVLAAVPETSRRLLASPILGRVLENGGRDDWRIREVMGQIA